MDGWMDGWMDASVRPSAGLSVRPSVSRARTYRPAHKARHGVRWSRWICAAGAAPAPFRPCIHPPTRLPRRGAASYARCILETSGHVGRTWLAAAPSEG
eukprot:scaffold801_cov296-Prasinococcus_capsulatus_cf.AAC.2